MTILHPRLLLAIGAGACVIAFTPRWGLPPAELPAIEKETKSCSAAQVVSHSPSRPPEVGPEAQLGFIPRPTSAADKPVDGAIPSAGAAPDAIAQPPSEAVFDEPPAKLSPPRKAPVPSDAGLPTEFAYADVPGAPPAVSALSEVAPSPPLATPAPEAPLLAPPLSSEAAILYNKGDVSGLAALAQAENDPATRLGLEWASLRANAHPTFAALSAFLEAHPTWPSRGWIRGRQEAELAAQPEAPAKVAEFFAGGAPETSAGKIAAARAAKAMGRNDEAARIIRALWRDDSFDALTESVILRDFSASLLKADHQRRADRLFYAGYVSAAARTAALAGPEVLALEEARVQAARAPMSSALVRFVPPALRNDPGLLFSRVQYARRAGRVYEAAVLLSLAPDDHDAVVSPDRWWSERKMVAAALLDLGEPRLAFEVCDQTVRPETSVDEVDAEFHAGWIALRFLNDPSRAAVRFALAAAAADTPLSIARAAYWQGRAAEARGGSKDAEGFFERAASEPIAYYGQLAAKRLGLTRLALRAPKAAAEGEQRNEAIGAVAALYRDGLDDLANSLAFDAAREWRDESQMAAMAEVVERYADAGTQVQFGKLALIRGYPLDDVAFPASGMPAFLPLAHSADLPTVYAVARQESEFIWRSSSWAGAKGLMQMMPATAVLTARQAGVEYDYARLIADPSFNTRLGAVLLGQLIADEGGSRELAFAAYNAGPGRVTQWIAKYGDPRNGTADLIDWIERIPFDETRDYVQRVSENLGVYRQRFADDPPAVPAISARMARE
jgi:soluble lytic murein transglycosylase